MDRIQRDWEVVRITVIATVTVIGIFTALSMCMFCGVGVVGGW